MNLFNLFKKQKIAVKPGTVAPTALIILDGFGVGPSSPGNAISLAQKPYYDSLLANYPHSELLASGEAVGLPANEVGNTEVGHLSMGAGRVILQDLRRIDKSIEDGSFFENQAIYHALFHAQRENSKLHIIGLVSSGHVHSSNNHLYALLDFIKRTNMVKKVYLHVITDGRDAPPTDGINEVTKLENYLKANNIGVIATISGRYYAMDRDRRWDRTKKEYEAMVKGLGPVYQSASQCINDSYKHQVTDEFIVPSVINKDGLIEDNDSCVFFNYRIDRPRQLTMAFVVDDFKKSNIAWEFDPYAIQFDKKHEQNSNQLLTNEPFPRGQTLKNLFFVTMTEYQKNLPVSEIAFPPEEVIDCLAVYLAKNDIKQIHMAESEKERFVTYYFDGLREERQTGEDVVIVPSPKVPTYDKKPEMSVGQLAEEFKKALNEDKYKFLVVNIANPDMVAHSGNLNAAIKAIEAVDKALYEMVEGVLTKNGNVLITGDHGNAEEMISYPSSSYFFTSSKGVINTNHSSNPVPLIYISHASKNNQRKIKSGKLADIAPTILSLLGLESPPLMTGTNLIS